MFLFVLLFLTIFVSLILVYFFRKNVSEVDDFPEPPGSFLFGHGLQIKSLSDVLEFVSRNVKNHGKIIRMRLGLAAAPFRVGYVVTDHRLVQLILSSNHILTKSENYKFLKPWLGNGLLLSDDDYWRRHRKILTPAFHFGILKKYVETFEKVGDVFVNNLKKYDGWSSFDLHSVVSLATLDVICETAMGTKIDAQNNENSPYVKGVTKLCQLLLGRCISPIKVSDVTYWLTKDYYTEKKILKILHSFTLDVINERKRNKRDNRNTKKMAFLDLLLSFTDDQDRGLTQDEIREEVDTFMFEGHDTTSVGICFTLFCLAEHPEIQEKVFQEQKTLFGGEKNPIVTYTELQNMKYLEKVVKETFRLYPPVPMMGRYLNEDLHFESRVLPKNSNIVLCIYAMHRDPDYFPDPETFDAERFENSDNSFPFAYIPFSAGSRNCIGQKFAMLEVKSVVSKVVRHFEVKAAKPRHKLELSVEAVLNSSNGIKVGLEIRK